MFAQLRLQERCHQFAGGIKAVAALAVTVALSLADFYDVVPLQPVLTELLGEHAATKLALYLPVIFAILRYVSTTEVHWHHHDEEAH
jgi:hypothetical protein